MLYHMNAQAQADGDFTSQYVLRHLFIIYAAKKEELFYMERLVIRQVIIVIRQES